VSLENLSIEAGNRARDISVQYPNPSIDSRIVADDMLHSLEMIGAILAV
jgi:hypothetical protein